METRRPFRVGTSVRFKDVVPDAEALMGVKAVWSRSEESIMCFGSRGNPETKDRGHFSQARITAERAMERLIS